MAQPDPATSSRAVHEAIMGNAKAEAKAIPEALRLAAGAENQCWPEAVGADVGKSAARAGTAKAVSSVQPVRKEGVEVVEVMGVEPTTFALRTRRSPS